MSDLILLSKEEIIKDEKRLAFVHLTAPKTCTDLKRLIWKMEQNARGFYQVLHYIQKSHRGRITDTINSTTVITANQPRAAHTLALSNKPIMMGSEGLLIPPSNAALATNCRYQTP